MKNKFLIVLIIIILLIVGGLGYYKYFILNKTVISKVNLSDTEVSTILDGFPYQMLIENKDVNVKDLTEEQIVFVGYDGLTENQIVAGNNDTCDTSSTDVLVKCIAKSLKLNDEQIGKINTSIWESSLAGSTVYEMVSPEIVNNIINNKLGLTNNFTDSFNKNFGFSCISMSFIYDKELNMLFIHEESGCSSGAVNYVINVNSSYKENDIYKINFTEGVFSLVEATDNTPITFDLHSRSNPTVILEKDISNNKTEDEMKVLVDKNKSSLDTYEITFKKVGNNYQFVSLDYIK